MDKIDWCLRVYSSCINAEQAEIWDEFVLATLTDQEWMVYVLEK